MSESKNENGIRLEFRCCCNPGTLFGFVDFGDNPPANAEAVTLPILLDGVKVGEIIRRTRQYSHDFFLPSLAGEIGGRHRGPFKLGGLAIDSDELPGFVFPYIAGAIVHTGFGTLPDYPKPADCPDNVWELKRVRTCRVDHEVVRAAQIIRWGPHSERYAQECRVFDWLQANGRASGCPIYRTN